ncbi:hypothetical protein [Aquella oligotrophica]|uniref:Uncharacterized protein n=1 Tax=Aquella oligotrophica TaxID=2067065 RepID=A0A2I7N5J7_9NEIS|nr:hypothetical protein [Aquella oligotrophica]AUR51495.1 hypothetical protein CUN60_04050 [Aquella oligotrophica]
MNHRYINFTALLLANIPIMITSLKLALSIIIIITGYCIIYKSYWILALLTGTTIISTLIGKLMPVITLENSNLTVNHENLIVALIIIPVPLIINSLFICLGETTKSADIS